jgi:Na+/phosphate symporter
VGGATLVFGTGLVLFALDLVGDALQGATALDTFARPDPTIVRGLIEASLPLFGAIGLIMSALFLCSAGYVTLVTAALPRWTGWLALAGAVVNLLAAPSIFRGTDFLAVYTAAGWVTYIGQLALVSWFVIASIAMLRIRPVPLATPVHHR